jgi:hypothetical protein
VTGPKEYPVLLEGVDALDLPLSVLRDLSDLFLEGAQRSARLVAEGRSVARGSAPAWVTASADLRVTKFAPGSLDMTIRAPRLVEVASDIFAQQQLFPAGTDPDATAFDLLLDAAEDAAAGRKDSERLDGGVLDVLTRTANIFARGGTRLTIGRAGRPSVVLNSQAASVIRRMADETPAARVARVSGVLDSLTVSTRAMAVRLQDGQLLRGFAGAVPLDKLKHFLGMSIVVEGSVTFRPSGEASRIEVESVFPSGPGDVIWAKFPKVESGATRSRQSIAPIGLDAFFGKWPGDETDDEIARGLKDLS